MSAVVVKKDAQGSLYVPLAAWRYRHGCDPPAPGMPLTDPLSPILSSVKFSLSTASDSTSGCAMSSLKILARVPLDHVCQLDGQGCQAPAVRWVCLCTFSRVKGATACRMSFRLQGFTKSLDGGPISQKCNRSRPAECERRWR